MTPIFVFDLDGTLTLSDHRTHLLADKNDPQRWRKFYAACVDDPPNAPVCRLFLWLIITGCDVVILTGRSDEVKAETLDWLEKFISSQYEFEPFLVMRKAGDHTPDHELKKSWYENLPEEDRKRIEVVFEDRTRVVQMWRDLGVTCFQVAPGEF